MKLGAYLLLAAAPMWAQVARTAAVRIDPGGPQQAVRIAQGTFTDLEKRFNARLERLFDANDPLDLLGNTRGVYLEGYGAVFTVELSLVRTPTLLPFRTTISKELAESVRAKKIQRLPALKAAMKEMLHNMAATFIQIPYDQRVVLIARFYYEPWENLSGMPSQVLMRATRKGSMAGEIEVEEQ